MLNYLILFGMSMLPIVELRGSLIFASAAGIPLLHAFPLAILGNLIPVPFILFLFEIVLKFFSRRRFIGPLLQRFWKKAEEKGATLGKYELLGVFLFVAIPIPGTGAWMGSLIATVLRLHRGRAMLAVLAGVLTAGVIMSCLAYLLPEVFTALIS